MSVLQTAERVSPLRTMFAQQSPMPGVVVQTRRTEARTRRAWRLDWDVATHGIAKSVRQHFEQFGAGGEFPYTPPGGSATTCIYTAAQVSIVLASGNANRISLTIEEAFGADS